VLEEEGSFDWLAPSDHPDHLGRLGDYEIIERLGQGGAKEGKFRILRVGSRVQYFVAEGTGDAFREIQQEDFTAKDFDLVRFMAQVNGAPSALDVLLKDLTIRAEGLPGWTGSPVERKRSLWWVVAGAAAVAAVLGAGVWWAASRNSPED
jgi:hypothetical protein